MTTIWRRRGHGFLAAAAASVLAAAACSGGQAAGPTDLPPGWLTPVDATPGTLAAGERRPDRSSALVRAVTCERFSAAVRPRALEAFSRGRTETANDKMARTMNADGASTAVAAPEAGRDFSATNV